MSGIGGRDLGRQIGGLFGPIGGVVGGIADSIFGGGGGDNFNWQAYWNNFNQQQSNYQTNRLDQYDFAQNSIRYRVDDARRAGIHPLAALGAVGASYTPTNIVGGELPQSTGGGRAGSMLSDMGQDISRAISATRTQDERIMSAFEEQRQKQMLQRGDLENLLLASQLARLQRDQVGPGMPANVGVIRPGLFEQKPNEVTSAQPGQPHITAGPAHPGTDFTRMPGGHYMASPAKPLQIDEVSSPGWMGWMYRNKVLPLLEGIMGRESSAAPPKSALPPGAIRWHFAFPGTWKPVYPDIPNRDRRGHLSDRY